MASDVLTRGYLFAIDDPFVAGAAIDIGAGETRHFGDLATSSAFVHGLTNTGETELVFVTVEFDPCRPSVQMMFEWRGSRTAAIRRDVARP